MDYKHMKIDDIIAWCQANGADKIEWLKKTAELKLPTMDKTTKKQAVDENGKKLFHNISFIELKVMFVQEFMPEIMPVAKPKVPSMIDKIRAL